MPLIIWLSMQALFVALKLSEAVAWSWAIIFIPTYVAIAFFLLSFVIVFVAGLYMHNLIRRM
jgi:hypothetical protein